jgi:uncharacterized protein YkwD
MRTLPALIAASVVAAVLLAIFPVTAGATAERASLARADATLAGQLRAAINEARSTQKLRRLAVSRALVRAARQHALAMARLGFFSHSSADGSSSSSRITSFYPVSGAAGWAVGEVLLWGKQGMSAGRIVSTWLASAPHRAQVLNRRWRELGVAAVDVDNAPGVYGGRDVTIVVVDFGTRTR